MNKIIGFIAVVALVVGVTGLVKNGQVEIVEPEEKQGIQIGAVSGPDVGFRMFLNGGVTVGGRNATTSTAATYTTVQKDFNGLPTYLDWTPNVDTTITFNATSTHGYVPQVGDVAKVYLRNASSTAASTITLAAENGSVDLQYTEATGGDLVLNGLDWGELTFIREAANTTTIIFNEFTEAD